MSKRTAAVPRWSPWPAQPAAAGNHPAARRVPALTAFVLSGLLFGFVGYRVGAANSSQYGPTSGAPK